MENPIYNFNGGVNDILIVYDDRVVIQHKGMLNLIAMGNKGDKTIYFSDITSIQFAKPAFISPAYIQFSIPGGNESRGGSWDALSDENTITLKSDKDILAKAEEIVAYLNEALRKTKNSKGQAALSVADELKKFKELLDLEIITKEEFEAKKRQLLGS